MLEVTMIIIIILIAVVVVLVVVVVVPEVVAVVVRSERGRTFCANDRKSKRLDNSLVRYQFAYRMATQVEICKVTKQTNKHKGKYREGEK